MLKLNRKSLRLSYYDYRDVGFYFITICTHQFQNHFGSVQNGNMNLSKAGNIVQNVWLETPKHFPYVSLEEYCLMPNHFHAILCINHNQLNKVMSEDKNIFIPPKSGSLSVIVRTFKTVCSYQIRKFSPNFKWQRNYYEHIIRQDAEYEKIAEYIINNAVNWDKDNDNPNSKEFSKNPCI